jgi:hypothetical protein
MDLPEDTTEKPKKWTKAEKKELKKDLWRYLSSLSTIPYGKDDLSQRMWKGRRGLDMISEICSRQARAGYPVSLPPGLSSTDARALWTSLMSWDPEHFGLFVPPFLRGPNDDQFQEEEEFYEEDDLEDTFPQDYEDYPDYQDYQDYHDYRDYQNYPFDS